MNPEPRNLSDLIPIESALDSRTTSNGVVEYLIKLKDTDTLEWIPWSQVYCSQLMNPPDFVELTRADDSLEEISLENTDDSFRHNYPSNSISTSNSEIQSNGVFDV